jgi:hypothetical protein
MIWSKEQGQYLIHHDIINAQNHKRATRLEALTYESRQNILNAISYYFARSQLSGRGMSIKILVDDSTSRFLGLSSRV